MSDAPTPDQAEAVPSVEELQRTAVPAAIRHAPRVGRMIGTGVWIGIALGVVLGIALPNSTVAGRGIVVILLSLGFALIGGLIAGVIATRLDKPLKNQSDAPLFPQDAADAPAQSSPADDAADAPVDTVNSLPPSTPTARPNGDTT
ncbi:hypothetical protein [Demequina aurantiaca]|uniref:hypothetical protein n=1 Tax=Demequina aurantiaca TaxID=676200 RepID=UPI003D32F0EF